MGKFKVVKGPYVVVYCDLFMIDVGRTTCDKEAAKDFHTRADAWDWVKKNLKVKQYADVKHRDNC